MSRFVQNVNILHKAMVCKIVELYIPNHSRHSKLYHCFLQYHALIVKKERRKNRFTCSWWNSNSQVYILFWILMIVLSTWGAHQCTVWREGIYTAELGATWADCKVEKHVYLRKQLTEVRIIHTGAWHIFLFVNELIT